MAPSAKQLNDPQILFIQILILIKFFCLNASPSPPNNLQVPAPMAAAGHTSVMYSFRWLMTPPFHSEDNKGCRGPSGHHTRHTPLGPQNLLRPGGVPGQVLRHGGDGLHHPSLSGGSWGVEQKRCRIISISTSFLFYFGCC